MSDFLLVSFLIVVTAMGLNKCNEDAGATSTARELPHTNAPITYVMAERDPFNRRYVFNPYRPNERLYVGEAPEGTLLLDPAGGPYVVGP